MGNEGQRGLWVYVLCGVSLHAVSTNAVPATGDLDHHPYIYSHARTIDMSMCTIGSLYFYGVHT